ncbi:hypothetical protein BGZ75_010418 [Mortierella antarctica]|nr:hypothetical protein BGZ75_010418 [Mortierella antarctica]
MTETPTAELWSVGGYLTSSSGNSTSSNSTASNSTEPEKQAPPGLSPGSAGWQNLTSSQVGSGSRYGHTATLVRSNGLLVVVGGVSGGALVPLSEILVYDTAAGVWSVQTATGATPPLRRNHVAVASSNGQIYVHGGTDMSATNFFADTAILDTTSWSWSQPAIEGTAPTGRYSHSAAMVGSNMIVTFGLTAGGATNNIFILDTISNTWVTSYAPNNLQLTSTKPEDWPGYKPPPELPATPGGDDPDHPPPNRSNSHVGPIIGGVVGVFAIAALALVLQPLATPGSPSSPRSPRHSGSGFGSPGRAGGDAEVGVYVPCIAEEEEDVPHGRAYSDGFENAMLEMDVQMLAVPRGRLYVVNPSDETLTPQQGQSQTEQQAYEQQAYEQFDSQRPRE